MDEKERQLLIMVDDRGRPTKGYIERWKAHLFPGIKHLAVQVLVFDAAKRLVLHHRNPVKIGGQVLDAPTTHVLRGENYESAARRCLKNEYGITAALPLTLVGGFSYGTRKDEEGRCEDEYCAVMYCQYAGRIVPNHEEAVGKVERRPFEQILKDIAKEPENYPAWFFKSVETFQSSKAAEHFFRDQ